MKRLILFTILIGLSTETYAKSRETASGTSEPQTAQGAPLYLEIGEQRLMNFPELYKYSLSGDSVHYVRIPNQNQILIKATKPGISNLTVFKTKSEIETRIIRVELRKNLGHPTHLLQSLNNLNETEVIEAGEHFILRGTIHSLKEANGIAYIREHFPKYIIDETEIDHTWFERSKSEITELLRNYPSLELTSDEGMFFIHGALPSSNEVQNFTKRLKNIQPLAHLELQTIKDSNPTIYFKVFLLEVKKEQLGSLGVEWPEKTGATFQVSPLQLLFDQKIDFTIHTLSQKGALKILSSPELVVRAPGQAELFAGGELPIRQRSKFEESVIWKKVGLSLKLDVKEFGGEKVRLNIETEISQFDKAVTNDNIPVVQSNRIKTQVDGMIGKPLLLSGLLQEGVRSSIKGLPWLSDLPVLGKLFSSEDYQNDRSELVAVLLPRREPPANPMQRISRSNPRGYMPAPRRELSADEISDLKKSKHFPWNAL